MSTAVRQKPSREQLPPDACLCDHCTAKCCRYFALPLDEPTEVEDFEFIRWFLLHDQIHHRGQFSIDLRMADGKVPSIYGPTADEPWF